MNSGEFKQEYATDQVFDYLLLKNGNLNEIATNTGVSPDFLREIRLDIEYYYGFDLRTSGKDLINNHLTFMLMHHVAIFPEIFLPKGISINGYVAILNAEEQVVKMSKSKGNFTTIEDAIEAYGVDATRLGFAIAGEGFKDAST